TIGERDAGPRHEVAHGPRREHLTASGELRHPGADVHGEPADVVSATIHLARVDTRPDTETDRLRFSGDVHGTADGTRGTIERREKAVARGADLLAAPPSKQTAHQLVVLVEQAPPPAITHCRHPLGRLDDVGEQHRRELTVDTAGETLSGEELLDLLG